MAKLEKQVAEQIDRWLNERDVDGKNRKVGG
jgi:hypothetical protein